MLGSRQDWQIDKQTQTNSLSAEQDKGDRQMNLIELAKESGMAVLLDGKIGREEYVSVSGSLAALARFAQAVREAAPAANSEESTS
jgi:hypothetical protein